jgi:hypothetical protein
MLVLCYHSSYFLSSRCLLNFIGVTYKTWLNLFPFSVTFISLFPVSKSSHMCTHARPWRSGLFAMWKAYIQLQTRLVILNGQCDLPHICYDNKFRYSSTQFYRMTREQTQEALWKFTHMPMQFIHLMLRECCHMATCQQALIVLEILQEYWWNIQSNLSSIVFVYFITTKDSHFSILKQHFLREGEGLEGTKFPHFFLHGMDNQWGPGACIFLSFWMFLIDIC